MAMANSWGLFLVIMFMGYGLVAVPRRLWFTGNPQKHLNQIYANASRVKEECMDSELEFIEVCKASIPSKCQPSIDTHPHPIDHACHFKTYNKSRSLFTWLCRSNDSTFSFHPGSRVYRS